MSVEPFSLAHSLKESTMKAHHKAEQSQFMKQLFQGKCSHQSYLIYLWALKEIYQTLEAEMEDLKDHDYIQKIYLPELFRLHSLEEDLAQWGFDENTEIPPQVRQAVDNYCSRLKNLAKSAPYLLTAHAYVRYLGDLSGGQMLGKVLPKNFQRETGFAFYDFSHLDAQEAKTDYRRRLDELGDRSEEKAKGICEEAIHSFVLNSQLFSSLDSVN